MISQLPMLDAPVGGSRGIDSSVSVPVRTSVASQSMVSSLFASSRPRAKLPKARGGEEERMSEATAVGIAGTKLG